MIVKYHLTILLLIVTCTAHKSFSTVVKNNKVQDDSSNSKSLVNIAARDASCGSVLYASDEFGTLSYNMQTPNYRQYQSCLWTIEATYRAVIKINVTDPVYRGSSEFIAVGYFNKSNYHSINSFTWIKLPLSYDPQYLEVPGPVAFIHYSDTQDLPRFGFRLTYEAGGELQSLIFNLENYFLEGESGIFKYPPSGHYRNNQRTTIVIKANSRISNPAVKYSSYIELLSKGIEDSPECNLDSVNIYGYGEASGSWYRNLSLCGTTKFAWAPFYLPRNDPLILTFQSDDSKVGGGFEIRWAERYFPS